jgi:hypothetical protein
MRGWTHDLFSKELLGRFTSHIHETNCEMQQIMVSSIDLRACHKAGKMTVHPSLSEEKAMMSQETGEHIGYGE